MKPGFSIQEQGPTPFDSLCDCGCARDGRAKCPRCLLADALKDRTIVELTDIINQFILRSGQARIDLITRKCTDAQVELLLAGYEDEPAEKKARQQ